MIHSDTACFSLFDSGAQLKRINENLNQLVEVDIRYDSFTIKVVVFCQCYSFGFEE